MEVYKDMLVLMSWMMDSSLNTVVHTKYYKRFGKSMNFLLGFEFTTWTRFESAVIFFKIFILKKLN